MSAELIILIAALIMSWLVFTALIKVLKTTVGTAIKIAVVILILQVFFGIGPQNLWQELLHLPQTLEHLLKGN